MWTDSVGEIWLVPFFPCAAPVDLGITSWSKCVELDLTRGRVIRKYCNAQSDFSNTPPHPPKKEKKTSNAAHMQQISSDTQTPVVWLQRAKPYISRTLQLSIQLVLGWSQGSSIMLQRNFKGSKYIASNHKPGNSPQLSNAVYVQYGSRFWKKNDWKQPWMKDIQKPSDEPRPNQTNIWEEKQNKDHRQGKWEVKRRASKQMNRRINRGWTNSQQTMSIQCS